MPMSSRLHDVGCVNIAAGDLWVLAEVRRESGVRVSIVGQRAWIWWDPASATMQRLLVERLLPLPGVELFIERGGRWYRPRQHLPALHVPESPTTGGMRLEGIVVPAPMTAIEPESVPSYPIAMRLVPETRGQTGRACALRCRLAELSAWSELATTGRLEALVAAWAPSALGPPEESEILVLGAPAALPELLDGRRFWGEQLLVPLGFRTAPELPESALCRTIGAGPDDLVVLDCEGYEIIPRTTLEPLSRAGIRLARRGVRVPRTQGASGDD
jgi:hypothetical protein